MMKLKLFFIFVGLTSSSQLCAQVVSIGTVPTVYNGGFAGEAGVPRVAAVSLVSTNYNVTPKFTTYANCISYDNFLKKIRSGISITAGQLKEFSKEEQLTPTPRFEKYTATIGISPKFSFRGKYTVAPFIDFSLIHVDKLLNYATYNTPFSQYNFQHKSVLTRTGLLINSAKAYVGLTVTASESKFDVKKPVEDILPNLREATVDVILQAGYTFQRFPNSNYSFTPQIAISWDRNSPFVRRINFHDISLIGRYKKFICGLNGLGIVTGYQNDKLRFMLSHWIFTSHNIAGSVGIRYLFPKSSENGPVSIQ